MTSVDTPPDAATLASRRVLFGTGAAALVAAGLSGADVAQAKPTPPRPRSMSDLFPVSDRSASSAVRRSDPLSGYTYRGVSFADFHPVEADNWRLPAATGFSSSLGVMLAAVDIPAGAVPRDIEWYFLNGGSGVEVAAKVWRPGGFGLDTLTVNNYAASTGPQVRRIVIPITGQIAYLAGSRLMLVFLSGGGQGAGILPAGETRTIALPIGVAPTGTAAVVINLTAVGAATGGYLRTYGAHAPAPRRPRSTSARAPPSRTDCWSASQPTAWSASTPAPPPTSSSTCSARSAEQKEHRMISDASRDPIPLARRRLLLGAGASALIAGGLRGMPAEAKPTAPPVGDPGPNAADKAAAARVTPSTLVSGYVYRSVSWADFTPDPFSLGRNFGGHGAYTVTGAGTLWATLDLPPGAVVREIEWYASNASGASVALYGRRWRAGEASFAWGLADDAISTAAAGVRARRVFVSLQNQIPFAAGTKIALGFASNGTSNTQIAGARVGLTGGGAVTMREVPYRAYDSRDPDKGILPGGSTRTLTLPGFAAPSGTSAAIVNLTALGASANGYLRAYAAGAVAPTTSSINFAAQSTAIANGLLVGISSTRQLVVYASATTHFLIDVLGTVS